jgi:cbb3-type cytochrome oxidase subunit 3
MNYESDVNYFQYLKKLIMYFIIKSLVKLFSLLIKKKKKKNNNNNNKKRTKKKQLIILSYISR